MPSMIETPPRRIAMLSYHTCPLATLGGKKTGGMNVYVRDLSRTLGEMGMEVDIFTRSQDECQPRVKHDLGPNARVIHIPAGPELPLAVNDLVAYVDEFVANILAFAAAEGHVYDIIHSHYWQSGLAGEQLRAAWGGIPLIHIAAGVALGIGVGDIAARDRNPGLRGVEGCLAHIEKTAEHDYSLPEISAAWGCSVRMPPRRP